MSLNSRNKFVAGYPVVTLSLGLVALVLFLGGEALAFLQYDRDALAAGEVWRGITGHWLHWSFEHFLWCTITFLALGAVCEAMSRRGYVATLAVASVVIPAACWFGDQALADYRGLSGLASAIFVFAAVLMAAKAWRCRDRLGIILPAAVGLGFVGKVLFEYGSGAALFVDNPEIFTPVPLVHLTGGGVGLLMACIFKGGEDRAGARSRGAVA